MKILAIADTEERCLWEGFRKERFEGIDLILSAGDLDPDYLEFLVTVINKPLIYVRGNHDDRYAQNPPEGCICIEDQLVTVGGLRILGLGGSMRYNKGANQYTEKQMQRRVQKLRFKLWRSGGVDILMTHSPALGLGDDTDLAHTGFQTFIDVMEKYRPRYMVHGHVHQNYQYNFKRIRHHGDTTVINAFGYYLLDVPVTEHS